MANSGEIKRYRRSDARFIRILPSCIPNRRFRPESRYVAPFADGRYLEIAQGNDEVEFGRSACLDINAEIIEIAKAGEGRILPLRISQYAVLERRQDRGRSHQHENPYRINPFPDDDRPSKRPCVSPPVPPRRGIDKSVVAAAGFW